MYKSISIIPGVSSGVKGPCVSVKVSSSTKECSFKNARAVAGAAALDDAELPCIKYDMLK